MTRGDFAEGWHLDAAFEPSMPEDQRAQKQSVAGSTGAAFARLGPGIDNRSFA